MVLTPALFRLHGRARRRLARRGAPRPTRSTSQGTVIIAGMGRFGQAVNRILTGLGHRPWCSTATPEVVERLRRLGIQRLLRRRRPARAAGRRRARRGARRWWWRSTSPEQAVRLVRHVRRRHPRSADDRPRPRPAPRLRAHRRRRDRDACARSSTPRCGPGGTRWRRSATAPARSTRALAEFARQDERMLDELAALWRPGRAGRGERRLPRPGARADRGDRGGAAGGRRPGKGNIGEPARRRASCLDSPVLLPPNSSVATAITSQSGQACGRVGSRTSTRVVPGRV